MMRGRIIFVCVGVILGGVFLLARLYIPLIGPRSARELVSTYSALPLPLIVSAEDAVDECAGLFCMDYYARGVIRLPAKPCARAIVAAKNAGWRELPLPKQLAMPWVPGARTTPTQGFFRYVKPNKKETRLSWLDTEACRVHVEDSIE
jgi:hypothetical protein